MKPKQKFVPLAASSPFPRLVREVRKAERAVASVNWTDAKYPGRKKRLDDARQALREALKSATWGLQSPNVFVDDRAGERSLSINRRAVAFLDGSWLEVRSHKEADRLRREGRQLRRVRDEEYGRARQVCLSELTKAMPWWLIDSDQLPRSFDRWAYWPGMEGGAFIANIGDRRLEVAAYRVVAAARRLIEAGQFSTARPGVGTRRRAYDQDSIPFLKLVRQRRISYRVDPDEIDE